MFFWKSIAVIIHIEPTKYVSIINSPKVETYRQMTGNKQQNAKTKQKEPAKQGKTAKPDAKANDDEPVPPPQQAAGGCCVIL